MLEKKLLDHFLNKLIKGGLTVKLWDGQTKTYGPDKPYFTLIIKNRSALWSIARSVTLGFGETYMDGRIEIEGDLDNVYRLAIENQTAFARWHWLQLSPQLHLNVRRNQAKQVQHHYDIGNDFYQLWLDESLTYSCAYFQTPDDSLEAAQQQKIDYLLKKLHLAPGQSLLDIGSGWGHLIIKAARDYQVEGLGITLSRKQHKLSNQLAQEAGVDHLVKFKLMNYRDLPDNFKFDRIISVGMFEHVGRMNHASYFKAVSRHLKDGGVSVLHTISQQTEKPIDPWIDKYIFPGGYLPSVREIASHLPRYNLRLVDYENLRYHYALTLDEWWRRFEQNKAKVIKMYDERFYRMWRLWLASSSATFRYGENDLSQFIFTKGSNNNLPLTRESFYK